MMTDRMKDIRTMIKTMRRIRDKRNQTEAPHRKYKKKITIMIILTNKILYKYFKSNQKKKIHNFIFIIKYIFSLKRKIF